MKLGGARSADRLVLVEMHAEGIAVSTRIPDEHVVPTVDSSVRRRSRSEKQRPLLCDGGSPQRLELQGLKLSMAARLEMPAPDQPELVARPHVRGPRPSVGAERMRSSATTEQHVERVRRLPCVVRRPRMQLEEVCVAAIAQIQPAWGERAAASHGQPRRAQDAKARSALRCSADTGEGVVVLDRVLSVQLRARRRPRSTVSATPECQRDDDDDSQRRRRLLTATGHASYSAGIENVNMRSASIRA
jgi:hypothetical protein